MAELHRGKTALVTGASRGLGREIARALLAGGADVALCCLSRRDLAAAVAQEPAARGRRTAVYAADLADAAETAALARAARAEFGTFDYLVCNAGETLDRLHARTSAAEWDRVVAVNLTSAAVLCRELLPALREGEGRIVFISSISAVCGRAGQAAYAAAKAGLLGLARTLAREEAACGTCVNVVLPGYMPTDMGLAAGEKAIAAAREENLLGRLNDAEEVAGFVSHLLTMRNVSGQVFNLDSRQIMW